MTGRSFRVGLVLGLAAGAAAAAVAATRRRPSLPDEVIAASTGIGVDGPAGDGGPPSPGAAPAEAGPADADADAAPPPADADAAPPPADADADTGEAVAIGAEAGPVTIGGVPTMVDVAPLPVDGVPADAHAAWITPLDGGSCPSSHPVKAKLASGIFHLPGMAMYGRTRADRCYRDPEAAEADGLRRSSR